MKRPSLRSLTAISAAEAAALQSRPITFKPVQVTSFLAAGFPEREQGQRRKRLASINLARYGFTNPQGAQSEAY